MKFRPSLMALALVFGVSAANSQESGSSQSGFNKSIDELTADEVLRLVRYSYTLYDKDFTGNLRLGLTKKVPFLMSLKPESIRFIFDNPAQVIHLDTRNSSFELFEGTGGEELKPVPSSKYAAHIRETDVTYDDLSMRFLYWPNAKIVKLDRIKQRDCWVVRIRNPDGEGSYSTVDVWIDKGSGGMLKMIGYNNSGRPVRRFEVLHGKKFGDIWMIDEMRIETLDPRSGRISSSTRMQIKSAVN
ncbi:MAG: outer membrane lipoprotein-sorting protein [Verrucomicrobiales bacterium]